MGLDFDQHRRAMVDCQVRTTDVTEIALLDAMLAVPREAFVQTRMKPFAYIDEDILVTATDAPVARFLMEASPFAKLVQLADVRPDDLVLDVGCASGYSSAVLSRLAGAVIALECDSELAERATRTLSDQGFDSVAVVTGPLQAGYPSEGPYDVIFVGGAVDAVPQALFDQLKAGGRLVVVEGEGLTGRAMLYLRDDEGIVSGRRAFNLGVKPLPGFQKEPAFVF